jgi:hypothetical protein
LIPVALAAIIFIGMAYKSHEADVEYRECVASAGGMDNGSCWAKRQVAK